MKNATESIVIDGVRITPELIAALKELNSKKTLVNIKEVKDSLFETLTMIAAFTKQDETFIDELQRLSAASYVFYQFLNQLETIECIDED